MGLAVLAGGGCDYFLGLERPDPPPDARMVQPGCSSIHMLGDDFEDGDFQPWWVPFDNSPQITLTESGGAMRMPFAAPGQGFLTARHYFDLRDDSFSFELRFASGDPASANIDVELISQEDVPDLNQRSRIVFKMLGGVLAAGRVVNGQFLETGRTPYDRIAHRFWRISQTAEVTAWSTSTDGQNYVELAAVSGLAWVTFVKPQFVVYRGAAAAAFEVEIDNLNGGSPSGQPCPAFALSDDFEDGTLGGAWAARTIANGSLSELAGQLVSTTALGPSAVWMISSTIYNLRDDALMIEVPQIMSPATTREIVLEVEAVAGGRAWVRVQNQKLESLKNASVLTGQVPYDPIAHRWWRLRETAGTLSWETSPDGTTFDAPFAVANDVAGLDRVVVKFGIAGTDGVSTTAYFDNVNNAPE